MSIITNCLRTKLINDILASDSVDIATVQEERIRIAKVGEIMIMAYRKGNVEYHNYTSSGNTLNNYDNPIPEKALKGEAKSHGIM